MGPLHPAWDTMDASCPSVTARGNKLRGCRYNTHCCRVFLRFASSGCCPPFPCQASLPRLLVMNDLVRVPLVPGARSCEAFFPCGRCRWLLRRRAHSCTLAPLQPARARATKGQKTQLMREKERAGGDAGVSQVANQATRGSPCDRHVWPRCGWLRLRQVSSWNSARINRGVSGQGLSMSCGHSQRS